VHGIQPTTQANEILLTAVDLALRAINRALLPVRRGQPAGRVTDEVAELHRLLREGVLGDAPTLGLRYGHGAGLERKRLCDQLADRRVGAQLLGARERT
jgi:hypothetical protein